MIKKTIYWTLTTIQVFVLISAYGIHHFASSRMGMMRYVVYINQEWERQYPIVLLQYVAISFFTLLTFIALIIYVKKRRNDHVLGKKNSLLLSSQIVLTVMFVLFTFCYSTEELLSYYFIDLILSIVVLIQNFKMLLYKKR